MCGIAGIVSDASSPSLDELRAMMTAIQTRGPDGEGTAVYPGCILGHRRLAIVDINRGTQPMRDSEGRLCVTFNGEIYGYQAIRRSLAGYSFHTDSDTEVLLGLYDRCGDDMPARLPGMFAFAIWDERQRSLFCARDRFGEKPFYYAWGRNGEFVFASEIKAILASGLVTPVLSRAAIAHYLARLYVHPNETIYKNVFVLPPAHALRFSAGQVKIWRYWDLPQEDRRIEIDEAVEQFRDLVHQATRKQLVADVPVGAFLSGGLDSSTLVAAATRIDPAIQTFSFDFEGTHSEAAYAQAVAQRFNTQHTELSARDIDLAELLQRMQQVYDEPFGDSSNIPTYLLAEQARRHVKVALCGDGGDELLGGYSWYKPLARMARLPPPSSLHRTTARILASVATSAGLRVGRRLSEQSLSLHYRQQFRTPLQAHRETSWWFQPRDLRALGLTDAFVARSQGLEYISDHGTVNDVMRWDLTDYMPGDILTKIDRASMAHGLELRAPFLDVDLATFCITLPDRLKVTPSEDKVILRRAFANEWPTCVRARSKQGFGAPVTDWLRRPAMRALVAEYLNNPRRKIYDLLAREQVSNYIPHNNYKTWVLLVLSVWLEQHEYLLA